MLLKLRAKKIIVISFLVFSMISFNSIIAFATFPTVPLPSIQSLKELKELYEQYKQLKKQVEKYEGMIKNADARQDFMVSMAYGQLDEETQEGVDKATSMLKKDENGNYTIDKENAVQEAFGEEANSLFQKEDWQGVFKSLEKMEEEGLLNIGNKNEKTKESLNNQSVPGEDSQQNDEERNSIQSSNEALIDKEVAEIEYKDKDGDGKVDTVMQKEDENAIKVDIKNDSNNSGIPDDIEENLKNNPKIAGGLLEKFKEKKRINDKRTWLSIMLDDYNTNYRMWLRDEKSGNWYMRETGENAGLVDNMKKFEKMVNENATNFKENANNMTDNAYKMNMQSNLILQNKILLDMYKTMLDTNRVLFPYTIQEMKKNSDMELEKVNNPKK